MTLEEQIDAFHFKIESVMEYFQEEFDIPYHAYLGVLEEVKKDFLEKSNDIIFEIEDDDDENENEDGDINYA